MPDITLAEEIAAVRGAIEREERTLPVLLSDEGVASAEKDIAALSFVLARLERAQAMRELVAASEGLGLYEARAAQREPPERDGWRKIETAPEAVRDLASGVRTEWGRPRVHLAHEVADMPGGMAIRTWVLATGHVMGDPVTHFYGPLPPPADQKENPDG